MLHKNQLNKKVTVLFACLFIGFTVVACDESGTAATDDPIDESTNIEQKLSGLSDLVGTTYILDIPSSQWTEPEGLGDEIAKGQRNYSFEVLEADASALTISVLLGIADGGVQDSCSKTYAVTGTLNADDMTFAIGPLDIESFLVGPGGDQVMAECHNFTITGQIVNSGAELVSGTMSAELDSRETYPLFYQSGATSGEELCAGAANVGMPCAECSFDAGANMCLNFVAEDFTVFDSHDLSLVEVAEDCHK